MAEQPTYSALAYLQASQVFKGLLAMDRVFPTLRPEVEAILADRDVLISLFASRVMNGTETLETVPETIREDVESFLGTQTTSLLLLVADIKIGRASCRERV